MSVPGYLFIIYLLVSLVIIVLLVLPRNTCIYLTSLYNNLAQFLGLTSSYNLIDILRGQLVISSSAFKKVKSVGSLVLLLVPLLYLANQQQLVNIPQVINKIINTMNTGYKFMSSSASSSFTSSSRLSGSMRNSKEARFAQKNGGQPGGISNDGNTCFMNSVIQSLASSREFLKFIDSYFYAEIEISKSDGKSTFVKSNQPRPELVFTTGLKNLIENVNGRYGSRGKEFSAKPMLNKMPNGPKQNIFTGYNQEDAQEFYQLVMRLVEKEYKRAIGFKEEPKPQSDAQPHNFVDVKDVEDLIFGCDKLGKLGKVYVPAAQVDPNLIDCDHKVLPLDLITPVDGISADRIGCMVCGEVGGIRYSVLSGLSLNLPSKQSYYSSFSLEQLLNEWITPEIIDDVNCNRCGLVQTKEFLLEKISLTQNETLANSFQQRVNEIESELQKNHITDEVFEKLTTKQMIRKTRKSKQILLGRPAPLLSIHINRSVFDPRTYMIVKNSSNVTFPAKLNLSHYVAEPSDINMDARLPFRKQDERTISKLDDSSDEKQEDSISTPSESLNSDDSSETSTPDNSVSHEGLARSSPSTGTEDFPLEDSDFNPKLVYNLKAVISHYGTHNYGHYICYRKLRGTWWRISDESVYVVTEKEVLNSQGTFMIFYEYDDGFKEILEPLDELEDEDEEEDEEDSASQLSLRTASTNASKIKPNLTAANYNESPMEDNEYESSGLSDDNGRDANLDLDYNMGEERAFHM